MRPEFAESEDNLRDKPDLCTALPAPQCTHYRRRDIATGQQLVGPAIVLNVGSTLVVQAGWRAVCHDDGLLVLQTTEQPATATAKTEGPDATTVPSQLSHEKEDLSDAFDPVFRDCFAQRLSAIATQMGIVLQQTAVSVNVKQRRDYSCAVFDEHGICWLAHHMCQSTWVRWDRPCAPMCSNSLRCDQETASSPTIRIGVVLICPISQSFLPYSERRVWCDLGFSLPIVPSR